MILSILGFFLGFTIGLFLYAQVLLPFIYGLPVSVYYFSKHELTVGAIFFQFISPLIWAVVLTVAGLLLHFVAPTIFDFLVNDPGSISGRLFAIAALLFNFISSNGRADMKSDYMQSTYSRFSTKTSIVKL